MRRFVPAAVLVIVAVICGCGPEGGYDGPPPGGGEAARRDPTNVPSGVSLRFLFENLRSASYFPLDGLAGVDWGEDGTLVVCDEARGRVHGLDPRTQLWFEFDLPPARPYLAVGRPNPFAQQTTIAFGLPAQEDVSLEVFDVGGRKVATLSRGTLPAGRHSVVWDGRTSSGIQVPSGAYYYRLRAGSFTQVQKLLIVR